MAKPALLRNVVTRFFKKSIAFLGFQFVLDVPAIRVVVVEPVWLVNWKHWSCKLCSK